MANRQLILDAAARVYGEVGFRGATTRRIAAEAGVNEVTLFRIFGSKASLLSEALRCCGPSNDVRPELPDEPADPERELIAWATGHLGHLERNATLIRTMMGEYDERPEVGSPLCEGPRCAIAQVGRYLGQLRRRGWIDPDVSPQFAASTLLGMLFSDAMGRELMPELYPLSPTAAARHYVRFLLRAIGYRAPKVGNRKAGAGSATARGPARKRTAAPAESRSRKGS